MGSRIDPDPDADERSLEHLGEHLGTVIIRSRRLDVQPELLILAVQPHSRRFSRSMSLEAPDPASGPAAWAPEVPPDLENARNQDVAKRLDVLAARNNRFFDEETGKLEQWAEDA